MALRRLVAKNPFMAIRHLSTRPHAKFLPPFSMVDKVCLVTGAARGLGYEFCRAFVQSGSTKVAILDLNGADAKLAAQDLIHEFASSDDAGATRDNLQVLGVECDVSSEQSVQAAYDGVLEIFGRLDAVVASAGIVENIPALDYPSDRMKQLYDINVHGSFYTAREAAKCMIPQGSGSIVLIASMSATIVNYPQKQAPYNASKAAVRHMASSLAVEWAKTGVRINVLSPGYMLTKLTKELLVQSPNLKKQWEERTPMGRVGEPVDLAGAIVFLASDASKFMTGSEIRIDGGYCLV